MDLRIADKISESDRNDIFSGLIEYNLERLEDKEPSELGIYLDSPDGGKLAGLIGETHGNWLEIEFLWVSEKQRGKHIGSELLEKAECVAKERGCKYSFLNTFAFQAPGFYRLHGYTEAFTLENYPRTGSRIFFIKEL